MKTLLLSITLFIGLFSSSCTSEYEERLNQGRVLINRINYLKERQSQLSDELIKDELMVISKEISVLAKLSGNESLFLREVNKL